MKMAFGVARKRLEELQNQRKAKLPVALEQRLGKPVQSAAISDRKPSATAQASMSSSRSPLISDSNQSQAQYGFPQVSNHSTDAPTAGRSGSFDHTNNTGGPANNASSFPSMQGQPSPNISLSSSTDPNAMFGGINWTVSTESSTPAQ